MCPLVQATGRFRHVPEPRPEQQQSAQQEPKAPSTDEGKQQDGVGK